MSTISEKVQLAFGDEAEYVAPYPLDVENDIWQLDGIDYGYEPDEDEEELEIDEDGDDSSEIPGYLRQNFGVEAEVLDPHGPGGGNPVLRVKGSFNAMMEFSIHYDASGADQGNRRALTREELIEFWETEKLAG